MNALDYVTRWHSFVPAADASVIRVGKAVRKLSHWCIHHQLMAQKIAGVGSAFFGDGFSAETELTVTNLEQPIADAPRSGYCKYCNILWVAEDPT